MTRRVNRALDWLLDDDTAPRVMAWVLAILVVATIVVNVTRRWWT